MTQKCPNCGARLKVVLFLQQEKQKEYSNGAFQSTQPDPPKGFIRSFIWRVLRNRPLRQQLDPTIIVRSELKTTPRQILIRELKLPVTEVELQQLADLYFRRGASWSRDNTVKYTSLGQYRHNRIKDAFLELLFLEATGVNQYSLTPHGFRFLRHYCE